MAEWVLRNLPDDVVVAPDYEDKWHATRGVTSIVSIQKYGKILYDAGRYDASYTANWWWDDYITPYDLYFTKGNKFDPYKLPLWLCDPYPYGQNPGDWVAWVMRQNAIQQKALWASAAVDWDEMTEAFYAAMLAKYHGAQPPTPPPTPQPIEHTVEVPANADIIRIVRK